MLPPFIIEQIRKREEEEEAARNERRPALELPIPMPRRPPKEVEEVAEDERDRGVVIIDLLN